MPYPKETLTQDDLKRVLDYDPATGLFRWRVGRGGRAAGVVAGSLHSLGYVIIQIDGVLHQAHRLAWLYVKGEWPDCQIDHENLIKSDNRFLNLRPATHGQNRANTGAFLSRNKAGLKGVITRPCGKKFYAMICVRGKKFHLGVFKNPQEAHAAYCAAAVKHHGEYARRQ